MTRVYEFVAAPFARPKQILSVYTTEIDGELVGLLTDPPSDVLGRPNWNPETKMLHHIASVTKSLLDDRLRDAAGLTFDVLEDLTEIVLAAPSSTATVVVDGCSTLARTLRINGLEFALADDLERDYYAIARPAGSSSPWPLLALSRGAR